MFELIRTVLVAGFLTALLTSSGCSWTDALKVLTPASKGGINTDADITVGKKEEAVNTDVQLGDNTESTQTADRIINTTQIDNGLPPWMFYTLILLAGWALPDPQTMGRALLSLLRALLPWVK